MNGFDSVWVMISDWTCSSFVTEKS